LSRWCKPSRIFGLPKTGRLPALQPWKSRVRRHDRRYRLSTLRVNCAAFTASALSRKQLGNTHTSSSLLSFFAHAPRLDRPWRCKMVCQNPTFQLTSNEKARKNEPRRVQKRLPISILTSSARACVYDFRSHRIDSRRRTQPVLGTAST